MTQNGYEFLVDKLEELRQDGILEKIRQLKDYATANFDCSLTKLALAWCIKNRNVSTVLLGVTNLEQLQENINCIEVVEKLTKEHIENIEKILNNKPEPYFGYGGDGMRQIETI